eukprot:SAG31_NODE_68_length_28153_cov_23.647717_17_plen_325_part_00
MAAGSDLLGPEELTAAAAAAAAPTLKPLLPTTEALRSEAEQFATSDLGRVAAIREMLPPGNCKYGCGCLWARSMLGEFVQPPAPPDDVSARARRARRRVAREEGTQEEEALPPLPPLPSCPMYAEVAREEQRRERQRQRQRRFQQRKRQRPSEGTQRRHSAAHSVLVERLTDAGQPGCYARRRQALAEEKKLSLEVRRVQSLGDEALAEGLFALAGLPPTKCLLQYVGAYYEAGATATEAGRQHDYEFEVSTGGIDYRLMADPGALAAKINSSSIANCNCEFDQHPDGTVWINVVKPVLAGQQLLASYGRSYGRLAVELTPDSQ